MMRLVRSKRRFRPCVETMPMRIAPSAVPPPPADCYPVYDEPITTTDPGDTTGATDAGSAVGLATSTTGIILLNPVAAA